MVATTDKAVKRARARQYMKTLCSGLIRKPSPKTLYKHAIAHVLGSADGQVQSEYVFCSFFFTKAALPSIADILWQGESTEQLQEERSACQALTEPTRRQRKTGALPGRRSRRPAPANPRPRGLLTSDEGGL